MTAIVEKELVHAPLASANMFLETFFAAHAGPKAAGARILLHAGDAARPAIVTLQPAHRPEDMTPRYHVHWEAESGGPYPVYDGELRIDADEDYDAFWLVLDGTYEPPGGPAGKVFDVVIGRRIATASARGLLTQIRAEIEALFSVQELTKLSL
jgi:hypothetical protein